MTPDTWTGRSACPYPETSLELIAVDGDREIVAKAADNAILWLWVPNKFLRHCFPLLDRWGFEEKSCLVWVKDSMKTGRWLRGKHEICVMAVRGSPGITLTNQTTVLEGKAREHSRKPEEFYPFVESLCEGQRRYDRFAREQRAGWFCGGNDASRFGEGGADA